MLRLVRVDTIVLLWLTMCLLTTAHEFSPVGLTCTYFGGTVREVGFLLLYFQPAFYCNVSDAWLFPEKSRMPVGHRCGTLLRAGAGGGRGGCMEADGRRRLAEFDGPYCDGNHGRKDIPQI